MMTRIKHHKTVRNVDDIEIKKSRPILASNIQIKKIVDKNGNIWYSKYLVCLLSHCIPNN